MRARYIGEAEGVVSAFGIVFTHDEFTPVSDDFAEKVKGNRFFELEEDVPVATPQALAQAEPRDENGDTREMAEMRKRFDASYAQAAGEIKRLNGELVARDATIEELRSASNQSVEPESQAEGAGGEPAESGGQVAEYVAKHRGRGSYSILRGDEEVREGLTKADADAFNEMTAEDKAAYVAADV